MSLTPKFPANPAGDSTPNPDARLDGTVTREGEEPEQGTPDGGTGNETTDRPDENYQAEIRRKDERLRLKQVALEAAQKRVRDLENAAGPPSTVPSAPAPAAGTPSPGGIALTDAQKREAFNQGYGFDLMRSELDTREKEAEARADAKHQRQMAEQEAANRAIERYPDLKDASSEFYEATNERLLAMYTQYDQLGQVPPPDSVLHAANDVALSGNFGSQSGTGKDTSWDALDRARNANRGAPPPDTKPATTPGGNDLPPKLRTINAGTRQLGATAEERAKNLDEFIAHDRISQQALKMREEE